MFSHDEKCDGACAGMGADDRANKADPDIFNPKAFFYLSRNKLSILKTIAMADKDDVVLHSAHTLFHVVYQRYK